MVNLALGDNSDDYYDDCGDNDEDHGDDHGDDYNNLWGDDRGGPMSTWHQVGQNRASCAWDVL